MAVCLASPYGFHSACFVPLTGSSQFGAAREIAVRGASGHVRMTAGSTEISPSALTLALTRKAAWSALPLGSPGCSRAPRASKTL